MIWISWMLLDYIILQIICRYTGLNSENVGNPFYGKNCSISKWLSDFEHNSSKDCLWFKYMIIQLNLTSILQIYSFSFKWCLLHKEWVDFQAISLRNFHKYLLPLVEITQLRFRMIPKRRALANFYNIGLGFLRENLDYSE